LCDDDDGGMRSIICAGTTRRRERERTRLFKPSKALDPVQITKLPSTFHHPIDHPHGKQTVHRQRKRLSSAMEDERTVICHMLMIILFNIALYDSSSTCVKSCR
jgi:hypothetical protein